MWRKRESSFLGLPVFIVCEAVDVLLRLEPDLPYPPILSRNIEHVRHQDCLAERGVFAWLVITPSARSAVVDSLLGSTSRVSPRPSSTRNSRSEPTGWPFSSRESTLEDTPSKSAASSIRNDCSNRRLRTSAPSVLMSRASGLGCGLCGDRVRAIVAPYGNNQYQVGF